MQSTTKEWIIQTVSQLPEKDAERLKDYLEFLTWKSNQEESEPKAGKNPIALRVIEAIEKSNDVTMEDAEALLQSIKEGEIPMERVNPKDGAAMVWIPAGEFLRGTTDAQIDDLLKRFPGLVGRSWFDDEKPQRRIHLDGYWVYKHQVTVEQYRRFCAETGRSMPEEPYWGWREDHPIVNVTWYDAMAYCKWAGVRLPTEAEWEKAARGTDGRIWPWGNEWDASKCNNGESGTTSVGNYPFGASPYGVMDMVGNVWEWCLDEFDGKFYAGSPEQNPIAGGSIASIISDFTNVKTTRVFRGGSWYYSPAPLHLRVAFRNYYPAGVHGQRHRFSLRRIGFC